MPWYVYAFLSAIFLSLASLVEKSVLSRVHSMGFSSVFSVLTFIFSLPFVFLIDFSAIGAVELSITAISAILAAIAFLLVAKALRKMEISTVSPLLALNPGTTAIAGLLLLGERLSTINTGGVVLMIVGSYLLGVSADRTIFGTLKAFFSSKYVVFVLLSLVFYAGGSVANRFLVSERAMDPLAFLLVAHAVMALFFMAISSKWGMGFHGFVEAFKTDGWKIALIAALTVAYRFFQLEALKVAYVGLVSAIKRSSSFFTTLIGGELFHERGVFRKATASLIIIAGCAMVVL